MKVDGELVRRRRLELGLGNGELARKARIDPSQLSRIQQNKNGAGMAALRRLAKALKVHVTDLYADELEPRPASEAPP